MTQNKELKREKEILKIENENLNESNEKIGLQNNALVQQNKDLRARKDFLNDQIDKCAGMLLTVMDSFIGLDKLKTKEIIGIPKDGCYHCIFFKWIDTENDFIDKEDYCKYYRRYFAYNDCDNKTRKPFFCNIKKIAIME